MKTTCTYCQGRLEVVREGTPPPHWGRLVCSSCQRGAGYAPTPMEEAHSYTMPFGKYPGQTLRQIAETDRGRCYLEWAAQNLRQDRMREVIRYFLDHQVERPLLLPIPSLATKLDEPPRLEPGPTCIGSNEVKAREVRPRGKRKRVTTVAAAEGVAARSRPLAKAVAKTKSKTSKGARKCKTAMV